MIPSTFTTLRAARLLILLPFAVACGGSDGASIDPGGSAANAGSAGAAAKAGSAGSAAKAGNAGNAGNAAGGASGGQAGASGASGGSSGSTAAAKGPKPVALGPAGDFVILAKSGIDSIPPSTVTGDIGVSPIDSTGITGFSLMVGSTGTFSTSTQLIGKAFASDYTSPTPSMLTTAVGAMETAFTDAAGRPIPDFTELGSGDLSGLTLVPGLYKWSTGVLISTSVTLQGGPDDVWILQAAGGITEAPNAKVVLTGGARPKNVFWQVYGAVALDTGAHFEGIVLSQTEITLGTGASVNGRLFSQTAVTLDASTVTQPSL